MRLADEIQKKNKPNTFNNLFGAGQPEELRGKKMVGRDSLDAFLSRQVASNGSRQQIGQLAPEDPRFEDNLRKFYGRDTPPVRQGGLNYNPGHPGRQEDLDDRALRKFYGVESQQAQRGGMGYGGPLHSGPGGYNGPSGYSAGGQAQRYNDPIEVDCANFFGVSGYGKISENQTYKPTREEYRTFFNEFLLS